MDELMKIAAYRGDDKKGFHMACRDLNKVFSENYLEMIHSVGRNIFPFILATDNDPGYKGVGAMFTLYLEDGSVRRTSKPPAAYEIYKTVSHIALTIYVIISPYFLCYTLPGWQGKLSVLKSKLN
jgi:hypothetical protein